MLKKLFKSLFCRHKYMPYGDYVTARKDGHSVMKHIWKCKKCGKIKYGK